MQEEEVFFLQENKSGKKNKRDALMQRCDILLKLTPAPA